jgi:hypothetical protein
MASLPLLIACFKDAMNAKTLASEKRQDQVVLDKAR